MGGERRMPLGAIGWRLGPAPRGEPIPHDRCGGGSKTGAARASRLLKVGMTSQTHESARAERAARRGEYSHFEHKLQDRRRELRDETGDVLARDVQEIRAIERALRRIALGTYGICVSCGQPIGRERLEAYPTANRCAVCQRAYEHERATPPTPRL